MRPALPLGAAAWMLVAALAVADPILADESTPRVERVVPARNGDLLTCRIDTVNLPGERIGSSIRSGLPSAIEMEVQVLDVGDRVVAGNRVSYRIAFDLWEEFFEVSGAGDQRRFDTIARLEEFLGSFPEVPVTPVSALGPHDRLRIRVGLHLHAIAPDETDRLGDWVSGESRSTGRHDPDGSEAFIPFGKLIRYFYRGARDGSPSRGEGTSEWFELAGLAGGHDEAD